MMINHVFKSFSSQIPFVDLDIDECTNGEHRCDVNAVCTPKDPTTARAKMDFMEME